MRFSTSVYKALSTTFNGHDKLISGILAIKTVPFSAVELLYSRGPVGVNTEYAMKEQMAESVSVRLSPDECIFHAVSWNGTVRLLDGYARVHSVAHAKRTERPESVTLVIFEEPVSYPDFLALQDRLTALAKQTQVQTQVQAQPSGLRVPEQFIGTVKQFHSDLVRRGPLRAHHLASKKTSEAESIRSLARGVDVVDQMDLRFNGECQGQLAAYFTIAQHADFCQQEAQDFIRKLNAKTLNMNEFTPQEAAVRIARKFCAKSNAKGPRTLQQKQEILTAVLSAFLMYRDLSDFVLDKSATVTADEFEAIMSRARSAAKKAA